MKLLYTLLFAFSFSTFAYCDEIIWDEDKIISTGYTKSGEYVVNKETYRRAIKDCETFILYIFIYIRFIKNFILLF